VECGWLKYRVWLSSAMYRLCKVTFCRGLSNVELSSGEVELGCGEVTFSDVAVKSSPVGLR